MSVYDQLIGQSHLIETLTAAVKAAASGEESQDRPEVVDPLQQSLLRKHLFVKIVVVEFAMIA